jgi:hypothetical protein
VVRQTPQTVRGYVVTSCFTKRITNIQLKFRSGQLYYGAKPIGHTIADARNIIKKKLFHFVCLCLFFLCLGGLVARCPLPVACCLLLVAAHCRFLVLCWRSFQGITVECESDPEIEVIDKTYHTASHSIQQAVATLKTTVTIAAAGIDQYNIKEFDAKAIENEEGDTEA